MGESLGCIKSTPKFQMIASHPSRGGAEEMEDSLISMPSREHGASAATAGIRKGYFPAAASLPPRCFAMQNGAVTALSRQGKLMRSAQRNAVFFGSFL